jgi:glycosyltransferase involved in cell wall biosynthesis
MANAVVANAVVANAVVANAEEPSVSLLTITQYSRRDCLSNLAMLIQQQVYTNIVEWVIVEGTPDKEDSIKNAKLISEMKSGIPIHFIHWASGQALSDLRNAGNESCKGDIIVCLDDDDYYPPTRVSHAVYRLQHSTALIAGCSKAYIYFYQTGQFFQFKSFGKGHSTNNCFAYKRDYLKNHQHLSALRKAKKVVSPTNFRNQWNSLIQQKQL